ncbi:MAG: hypothetical protein ACR2LS_00330 [Thermomicrobiales bacterium]
MIVFPLIAALLSVACTVAVATDLVRRPRPDKTSWLIAFALFAIAAGSEVVGSSLGWTPLLARLYYLTGAVLVVGFLALGELYLLAGDRIRNVAPGAALLITAFAASAVWAAPIDQTLLATEGWEAISRPAGSTLYFLAIGLNAGGTFVLVGGLIWSAGRFWRLRTHRNRMIGCLLIALGALTVAAGGTLTRLGDPAYLYIAMSAGIAIIFAGYLQTRLPASHRIATEAVPGGVELAPARRGLTPVPLRAGELPGPRATPDAGVEFLETRFLPLVEDELAALGRVWSVDRPAVDRMTREEARRVWALRLCLSPEGQRLLDVHSAASMLQLSTLYFDVFAPVIEPATPDPDESWPPERAIDRA